MQTLRREVDDAASNARDADLQRVASSQLVASFQRTVERQGEVLSATEAHVLRLQDDVHGKEERIHAISSEVAGMI